MVDEVLGFEGGALKGNNRLTNNRTKALKTKASELNAFL